MEKIRFGIIGCGLMGREFASAAMRWAHLKDMPGKPVIEAVCNRSCGPREWFVQGLDTLRYETGDYRRILEDKDIDAVYIAVPHDQHEKLYVEALEAGKHVLGEKPFGIDRKANRTIVEAVRRHPELTVRCASQFPYYPACQELIRWIEQKKFGQIIELRTAFRHSSDLDLQKPINWKRTLKENGAYGCMGDLGIHVQHVAFRSGWKPERVYAQLSNLVPQRPDKAGNMVPCETWDNALLLNTVRDEDGNTFPWLMETKRMSPGSTNDWSIEVYGMNCAAKFSTNDPNGFFYTQSWGREQAWCRVTVGSKPLFPTITGSIFEFGFSDAILQMWAAYIRELCGEKVAFGCFTPEETLLSHDMLTAALVSQKESRAVALDELDK